MARKILLADDSVTAQNMGRKILTDAGYEVLTVNNGSAALKKINASKPDVVVLDVYMPGYSGLEVCQRIKEGRDTANIPVLLTVGKLEPFKSEDARRVRADAFIIKPFEASELLAALGKMEERLSATAPEPASAGKGVPTTMESFERMLSRSAPKFGDQESGWKARITVPTAGATSEETERDSQPSSSAAGTNFREIVSEEPGRPAFATMAARSERTSSLDSLPADVTAEELAAISAAAAAIGAGINVGKEFERLKPTGAENRVAEPASEHTVAVPLAESGTSKVEEISTPASLPAPTAASSGAPREIQEPASSPPAPVTFEVPAQTPAAEPVRELVAVAVGNDTATMAVGTRWVAEEVPVHPDESVLVLEREMHKAFAAFAAAEHAVSLYEPGPVDKSDEPMFASMAPAIPENAGVAEEAVCASLAEKSETAAPPPVTVEQDQRSSQQFPKTLDMPKPPSAPFASVASLRVDESHHAVAAFGGPHPFGVNEESDEGDAPAPETSATEATLEQESRRESELAAATAVTWANSHNIREKFSAATPAPSRESAAETEATASAEVRDEAKSENQSAMAAAASAGQSSPEGDGGNLSSIVDSMLAELKPRLMAELAKKLEKK